ncbi:hypothetical protein TEA_010860 [Camellia sinensis var. sinensis]|uniref:RNA helicase n=1 Tax=Camellia sinensis var. sinensis TaxID=542762 RepID=A0A4S4DSW5_CAMSN|nr:hypothetical protein TEA_010860 [Camellia sinensis var. sinensis]
MMATATVSSAGPRYAPEDPTLPKPWKGLVDGKTGYLYFWNPETNVTQYEKPAASSHMGSAPPQKLSSAPASSSVQVQQSSHGHRDSIFNDDDDRYNGGSNTGSKLDTGTRSYQSGKGESDHSQNVPNEEIGAGHGGSSGRGYGLSAVGNGLSVESYRRQHEITISGDNVPPPLTSFEATGFPSELLREVKQAGFSAPTPIQAQSWPIALQKRDIVAIAKTGSGKTLGYLIPSFIHLKRTHNNPQMGPTVLVLSPTRELATQIHDEAVKFGKSSKVSCTCLYGGAPKGPQLKELYKGVDIVVATPGRLNDFLEMKKVNLHQISYLVLDEADRMLDMGFEPQIRKIVKEVPTRRQTLMYTATWPKEVRKIAADLLVNPVQVNIGNVDELVANKSITQYIEVLQPMEKHRRLEQILRSQEPGSKIIIFCSTKKMCDQLARNLTRQFGAAAIHGDKNQSERDNVLSQFRSGNSPVLVATDVAARGLDVKDIRVVINYDFPTGVEDYVHRIGRTGRAGATGLAYTFFGDQDAKHASDLIKILEGADQCVPAELRDMAARGGFGMGRPRRPWGSDSGGRNDSGYGGRNGCSGYGGRGGGHGSDLDSQDSDRYGRSVNNDADGTGGYPRKSFHEMMVSAGGGSRARSRSRSPNKGSGWGVDGARSRSPPAPAREHSPVRSFHQKMMEQARPVPSFFQQQQLSLPNNSDVAPSEWGRSPSGGQDDEERGNGGPRSSNFGKEEEGGGGVVVDYITVGKVVGVLKLTSGG